MNQLIKMWCEKNGFVIYPYDDVLLVLKNCDYHITIYLYTYPDRYLVLGRDSPAATICKNDIKKIIKNLEVTLQVGLPMLWGF